MRIRSVRSPASALQEALLDCVRGRSPTPFPRHSLVTGLSPALPCEGRACHRRVPIHTHLGTWQVLGKIPSPPREGYFSLPPCLPHLCLLLASPQHSTWPLTLVSSLRLFHLTLKGPPGEDPQLQLPLMSCRPEAKPQKWSDQTAQL